jgi:hypothetical protein
VSSLKAAHRQQLELVDARVQAVVGKKDALVAALRGELAGVAAQMAALHGLAG